jgi:hypothetical protein
MQYKGKVKKADKRVDGVKCNASIQLSFGDVDKQTFWWTFTLAMDQGKISNCT